MNQKGAINIKVGLIIKIAIPVLLILGISYLYQAEVAKSRRLLAQVDELSTRARMAEDRLEDSKKKVSDLTIKLQEAKERIAAVTEELNNEKAAHQESMGELEQIKADIEQQKISRQDIENKLNQAQDEGRKLREQLKEIERKKAELESKIRNLMPASGVELGKVVVNNEAAVMPAAENASAGDAVKPDEAATADEAQPEDKQDAAQLAAPLEGKVTVVNKEYNFAVINLGQKDGVNTGDQFSVTRDGKVIGDLKVEKVHESMSAAGFSPDLKDAIQENDLVVQKAK